MQVALGREIAIIHRVAVQRLVKEVADYVKSVANQGGTTENICLIRDSLAQIAVEAEIG